VKVNIRKSVTRTSSCGGRSTLVVAGALLHLQQPLLWRQSPPPVLAEALLQLQNPACGGRSPSCGKSRGCADTGRATAGACPGHFPLTVTHSHPFVLALRFWARPRPCHSNNHILACHSSISCPGPGRPRVAQSQVLARGGRAGGVAQTDGQCVAPQCSCHEGPRKQ
jgi:hypothetical protein